MSIDYNEIYKQAALKGGWSKAEPDQETSWGDMYLNILGELTGEERILDIGTAEGKRFLMIAEKIKSGVGIDSVPEMIELAKQNAKNFPHITFRVMDSDKLDFPDGSFDLVIARHAPFELSEVARVLSPGGRLITQQIHETDKMNIKNAFGRGQDFGVEPGSRLERYKKQAELQGMQVVREVISDQPYVFSLKQELIDYLGFTPTISDFDPVADAKTVEEFINENKEEDGIISNSARFYLELKKV